MTNEHSEQSEDITQDPEYIRGYEQGVEEYRRGKSVKSQGFYDGFNAASNASKVVGSKTMPSSSKQEDWLQRIEERLSKIEERLGKLERYTQE